MRRILRAVCLTMVSFIVTWPSPAMATFPSRRTATIVVERIYTSNKGKELFHANFDFSTGESFTNPNLTTIYFKLSTVPACGGQHTPPSELPPHPFQKGAPNDTDAA